MPALDFPATPTNGQVYTQDGSSWTYDSTKGAWRSSPYEPGAAITSATAPTNPQNGDIWFDTDDGTMYVYYNDGTSSQWTEMRSQIATSQVGLVPCVPSSISVSSGTGTVNALGQVSFTGVSTVSLNNVFSSAHKNYKIIISGMSAASASTTVSFRYRVSGVDESSAKYYGQGMYQNNISSYAASSWSGTTSAPFANATTNTYSGSVIEVLEPFTSTKKTMAFDSTMGYAGGLVGSWHQSIHDLDMSLDGFTLFASAAITGSIQVYAYND